MKIVLKIILGIFLLFFILIFYGLHIFGIIGTPKPRNLGITYTDEDFQSQKVKSQVAYEDQSDDLSISESIKYTGSHEVESFYTSSELTSVANERNWKYLPFSNVQIRLNNDGSAEISANIDTRKLIPYLQAVGGMSGEEANSVKKYIPLSGKPPFYIKISGEVQNNDINLNIHSLSIGPLSVPQNIISGNSGRAVSFIQKRLNAVPQIYINSLKISDGKLQFTGKLPDKETLTR